MQIQPAAMMTETTESDPATRQPQRELTGDAFMLLLVTQLRAQNPLDPLDPNQFLGQLVQFNMLDQMIRIRQSLEGNSAAAQPSTPPEQSVTESSR